MLSDSLIRHAMRWRGLEISPFLEEQLQPASYDVTLHPQLLVLREGDPLDPRADSTGEWSEVVMRDSSYGFILRAGQLVLGSTIERFTLGEGLLGQLEGKSSLGRLGLQVHSTAGYLDPGFSGQVTLELSCTHSRGVILYPYMPIGQVAFDDVLAVKRPYQGKYQGQQGPVPSRYHENWDEQRARWVWRTA